MSHCHERSHKLRRRAEHAIDSEYVRLRVVQPDLHDTLVEDLPVLFADGRIIDEATIERSELLQGILQTHGETVINVLVSDFVDFVRWDERNATSASAQRLSELLQVATFLIDVTMVSDVTAAIAQSLRTSIRNEALASWALTSLPAVYTDTHTAAKDVLAVLSSMQDFTLADVLHHMHLSELLHCPESLQQIALAGKVQQSCCMLRQQLAWHPRCKQGCPAPASSFFSSYARYIQKLKVQKLDLSANGISETDVPQLASVLASLPDLRSLDLQNNPIDDSSGAFCCLLQQSMQRSLVHVKLPASALSTAPESLALATFACMVNLQTLDISGSVLTERMCTEFVSYLKQMSSLEHLGMWGAMLWGHGGSRSSTMVIGDRPRDPQTGVPVCSMYEHIEGVFQKLPQLTSLEIGPTTAHLRNAGVTDAVFVSLVNLSKLQSLRICARHVSCDNVCLSLSQLEHLSHLAVLHAPCLDALLRPLRHCNSLSVLHATRCLCRTLVNGALASLTHISELHLDLAATTEDALHGITRQLQALPRLYDLRANVHRNARWQHDWSSMLHSLAPPALHALPALTALELPPFAGSELPSLASALRALPELRQLSLLRRNRNLPLQRNLLTATSSALEEFGAAVATLVHLEVLELPFSSLHACVSTAAATLTSLTALTRLALSVASQVCPAVAAHSTQELGTSIACLRQLHEVSLQFPEGSSDILVALAPYLGTLNKLDWLEMEGLPIGGPVEYSDVLWDHFKALPLQRGLLLH